tara:strand:- start:28990 stop:30879 length:1890 start_codon:yes stop_codon:yes gene_type:complete
MLETYSTPNNGIASFAEASPDYELAPVGLASFQDQAKKLAEYGRNGDIYVVHAAEGETVVPLEVLNANPKVKELLFNQMKDMGLDPQEFVVGNELNSINPVTGLPEFFFKSVFRAVKKAVKKVAKIVKKAAPIVLPIAAAAFGIPFLGPAFGAGTFGASFLGSGIGTLVGGGSVKDAFKSGLLSGGLSVATAGLGSLMKGGDFGGAIKGAFTGATPVFEAGTQIGTQYAASPFADVLGGGAAREASALASEAQFKSLFGGDVLDATLTGKGRIFGDPATSTTPGFVGMDQTSSLVPSPTTPIAAVKPDVRAGEFLANRTPGNLADGIQVASANPRQSFQQFADLQPAPAARPVVPVQTGTTYSLGPGATSGELLGGPNLFDGYVPTVPTSAPTPSAFSTSLSNLENLTPEKLAASVGTKDFLDKTSDVVFGTTYTPGQALKAAGVNPDTVTAAQYEILKDTATELVAPGKGFSAGALRTYGPLAAVGTGAAYLGGAFDEEEPETVGQGDLAGFVADLGPSGYELFQQDPEKYKVRDIDPFQYVPSSRPLVPVGRAKGGSMEFPRREMLVEGPGTETSDDIPAMLSDGEFVLTSKAVRGAAKNPTGNKEIDRKNGAKNLYAMMRNFEMRA